jgi:replicative DNA helicase
MNLQQQLLGRILNDTKIYFSTGEMITDLFFDNPIDKQIFNNFKLNILNGEGIDLIKISGQCSQSDSALIRISEIIGKVDYSLSVQSMLDMVYLKIKQNKIKKFKNDIINTIELDPDKTLTFINDFISTFDTSGISVIKTMRENVDDILKLVEFNKSSDGLLTGIDTGFKDLNRITNGLQGGDLIIVAAETSQGKTSFALNMAQKAGVENDVYLISCEMQAKQITSRMLSYDSEISSNHIQTGKLGNDETERLYHFAESVAANKLLINGNDNDIDKIIASIRVFHATKNIKMVVIDYLQLIATEDRGSKEQQTAKITRRLKNLAKEIDIPIILLSQLSRDKQNPFPRLSRLRDSGQIEEAADIVIFIWRPEMYNIEYFDFDNSPTAGRAEIIVAKGRNSGTGVFHTTFHKHLTKFSDEF